MLFALYGLRFPLGPDGPVYLWWTRVAGLDGLSSSVQRPGAPAVVADPAGHAAPAARPPSTAALEVALGGRGRARRSCAFARGGGAAGTRRCWPVCSAGLFAVHLAAGYLAKLAFAAAFIVARVRPGAGSRAATVAAAIALGGGGLVASVVLRPRFGDPLPVAAVALLVRRGDGVESDAGRIARRRRRRSDRRGGLLSWRSAPRAGVDTSRDGFLRRAGLGDIVRSAYRDRSIHGGPGTSSGCRCRSRGARVRGGATGSCAGCCVAWRRWSSIAAPVGLATGWFPRGSAHHVRVRGADPRGVRHRVAVGALAEPAGPGSRWSRAALVVAMAAGAFIAWRARQPFIVHRGRPSHGRRAIADTRRPPGAPLVFVVDDPDDTVSFLATRAANVIRAAVPPGRSRDVHMFVGARRLPADGRPRSERGTASTTPFAMHAGRHPGATRGPPAARRFVLSAVDRTAAAERRGPGFVRSCSADAPAPASVGRCDPLRAVLHRARRGRARVAVLAAARRVAGYGWARWAVDDPPRAAASAPAFGVAPLRSPRRAGAAGVPLDGWVGPALVLSRWRPRRVRSCSSSQPSESVADRRRRSSEQPDRSPITSGVST